MKSLFVLFALAGCVSAQTARHLTDSQKSALCTKRGSGAIGVFIPQFTNAAADEADQYASEFSAALSSCGWTVIVNHARSADKVDNGLEVLVYTGKDATGAPIREALQSAGLSFTDKTVTPTSKPDRVEVFTNGLTTDSPIIYVGASAQ